MSKKLTPPLEFEQHKNMRKHIESLREVFYKEFGMQRTTPRPNFRGQLVYVDLKTKNPDGYPKKFIHLIGFDENEINFNENSVLACINDKASIVCPSNCLHKEFEYIENTYPNGYKKKKYPCLYRGARLIWINQIIELVNNNSPYVTVFEEIYTKKGVKETDVHLRYREGIIDYDVILNKHKSKNIYYLKTAFPVLHPKKKKDLDRKELSYLSQSKKYKI